MGAYKLHNIQKHAKRPRDHSHGLSFSLTRSSEPESEPDEELPVAELIEDEEAEEEAAPVKKPVWKILLLVLMWTAIALVVLVGAYVAVSHLCPEWIDQFLYTPEELELLNNIYE